MKDKCPQCGGELREVHGDVECSKCFLRVERRYETESIHFLKRNMSIEDAQAEISNCVYNAACIIEALEDLGIYTGNGHHAAQEISNFAVERFMKGVVNK